MHTHTPMCVCFTCIPHCMQHTVKCSLTETNMLATCVKGDLIYTEKRPTIVLATCAWSTEQGSFAAGGRRDKKVANHRHDSAGH